MGWRVPDRSLNHKWEPKNIATNNPLALEHWGQEHLNRHITKVDDGVAYDINYFHEHILKLISSIISQKEGREEIAEELAKLKNLIIHTEYEVNNCCDRCLSGQMPYPRTLRVILDGEAYFSSIQRLYALYTYCGIYFINFLSKYEENDLLVQQLMLEAESIELDKCNEFMNRQEIVDFKSWLRSTSSQFQELASNGQ